MSKNILLIFVLLGLTACVNNKVIPDASGTSSKVILVAGAASSTVKVYKFKKSVSCNQQSGVSVSAMRVELTQANVAVKGALCGTDGIARAAVCGTETGYVNVYEINATDIAKAKSMGFMLLSGLNGFSQVGCGI